MNKTFADILAAHNVQPATVAKGLGLNKATVSRWREVPPNRVIAVERVTGISRHELRPDLSSIFIGSADPAPSLQEAS